ncbi:MAG: SDR family oxidoreductase [Solirubrobacterales bacterium]|nr:SDR family oxidoreductase [Solirubrobacterales bacterium]
MEVLVAGGHGQIGLRLLERLGARGDRARGLIRNPKHTADLEAVGAEAVLCDLESEDPTPYLDGADAIVFAAGAGPGSGDERKRSMDYGGAVKLVEAALATGVARYVMVSSMGASDPDHAPEAMRAYQRAKGEADAALVAARLDHTIVRPGGLTNDPGTGSISAAVSLGRRGTVSRDDVADTLVAVLDTPSTVGKTFELLAGDTPIRAAVSRL